MRLPSATVARATGPTPPSFWARRSPAAASLPAARLHRQRQRHKAAANGVLNDFDGSGLSIFSPARRFGEAYKTPAAINVAVTPLSLATPEIQGSRHASTYVDQPAQTTGIVRLARATGSTSGQLRRLTAILPRRKGSSSSPVRLRHPRSRSGQRCGSTAMSKKTGSPTP